MDLTDFHAKYFDQLVTGASIRIGYFESDADLRYHDEVHGNLLTQVAQPWTCC